MFEADGVKIVISKKDQIKSVEITARVEDYPWGKDLAISSSFELYKGAQ